MASDNDSNNKLVFTILGALFTVSIALSGYNVAMTQDRLDRIEDRQQMSLQDRRDIDTRMTVLYGALAERLARIEAKLENEKKK